MKLKSWARRLAAAVVALTPFVAGGCKLDRTGIREGSGPLVVHAVLDPGVFNYTVLVEETLTGRVDVGGPFRRDSLDPVVAGGGVPVTGATVYISDDEGHDAVGEERVGADGRGRGVYHFQNQNGDGFYMCDYCISIARGKRYHLRVTAAGPELDGRVATAETTTPLTGAGVVQTQARLLFDRTTDEVRVRFSVGVTQERFMFRVSTPYGPVTLFTDSTGIVVPGTLTNFSADGLPPAFVPGFRETITVSAVDVNYFDYYRSSNSQFTGAGIINHLRGATGLFGSIYFADTKQLDVRAPYVDPLDGRYVGGASGTDTLEVWMGARVTDGRLVSGSLRRVQPNFLGVVRTGVLGATTGTGFRFDVLNAETADDIYRSYRATVSGGVLTAVGGGETLTFRRIE